MRPLLCLRAERIGCPKQNTKLKTEATPHNHGLDVPLSPPGATFGPTEDYWLRSGVPPKRRPQHSRHAPCGGGLYQPPTPQPASLPQPPPLPPPYGPAPQPPPLPQSPLPPP
eukprot:CAMPEP_0177456498 /NCGR_PEP_ID=MMETSP0369-20130122/12477_1 /TAXON_ID=447022 ORGANISM="Scrippsiella hangoei-like, Strain SHHI-4" /NCGR_SAMPLE_ID=MMETSP0369 /ASSEMBLY_ACC=CAM_ASM_000364 /LENGTH=111 /DNA_ID=CAMNT_0018929449 /DNA_START=258 /DNA_END=590 /DNA_ORIENTATION=-